MKERIRKTLNVIPLVVCYIVWALFFRATPLFFDMLAMKTDYLVRNSTLIGVLKAVFFTGGAWRNARYLVNIINIYIVSYEWISDWIMPLIFVLSVWLCARAVSVKYRWYTFMAGVGLFWTVSNGIVGQCYSYSYVLYLFPILFLSLFIYILYGYFDGSVKIDTNFKKVAFLVLIYCNACFLENVSCAFSVLMMLICFRIYVFEKRKDRLILIGTLVSLSQTLYMNLYLIILKTRPLPENPLGLFETIGNNFRTLVVETWLSNPIIVLLFIILIACNTRNKAYVAIDVALTVAFGIWVMLVYKSGWIDMADEGITSQIQVPYVPIQYGVLWAVLYIGANVFLLYQVLLISKKIATAFFVGGCSMIPVLLTPNTGFRISAFYVFTMVLSTIMLIQKCENKGKVWILVPTACILTALIGAYFFLPRIIRINDTTKCVNTKVRESVILQENKEWEMDKDVVLIPCYDVRDVFREGRPDRNSYYMWNFCYVNGLDKETIIKTYKAE